MFGRRRLQHLAVAMLLGLAFAVPVQAAPGPKIDVTIGYITEGLCTSLYVYSNWGTPIAGQYLIHTTLREAHSYTRTWELPALLSPTATFKYQLSWPLIQSTSTHHFSATAEIVDSNGVLLAKGRDGANLLCDFVF
jgi:hypothetical protein